MKVNNQISGSVCVVELKRDRYVDIKKDVRYPGFCFIEYVKQGFVIKRDHCLFEKTPETVLKIIRDLA